MDELEIIASLTGIVEAWVAQGSSGAVETDRALPDVVAVLMETGYLRADGGGNTAVTPTTEALNLTDPFLCEELASAFRWEFHRRYLAHRLGEI